MTFLFFTSPCSCSEYLSFVVAIIIICFWHLSKAKDANTDWNGFLFRLDRRWLFIWIVHSDSPPVCSIVLLHLHRLCSSLDFFPQSISIIRKEHRIKIFQISSIIFLLLVSKHTIHGDHFELSPPQTPDFSVVSRHSQPIFPNCDSFPTKGY